MLGFVTKKLSSTASRLNRTKRRLLKKLPLNFSKPAEQRQSWLAAQEKRLLRSGRQKHSIRRPFWYWCPHWPFFRRRCLTGASNRNGEIASAICAFAQMSASINQSEMTTTCSGNQIWNSPSQPKRNRWKTFWRRTNRALMSSSPLISQQK